MRNATEKVFDRMNPLFNPDFAHVDLNEIEKTNNLINQSMIRAMFIVARLRLIVYTRSIGGRVRIRT